MTVLFYIVRQQVEVLNCIYSKRGRRYTVKLSDKGVDEEFILFYTTYVDMVYRICFMFLKNTEDTEDAVQSVFIKVIEKDVVFKNTEHEKAWLIVTAQNYCKNQLKHWWHKRITFEAHVHEGATEDEQQELLGLVMALPDKYKMPIYLYYYEGYKTEEIATVLQINGSTLRSRLKKGRELLKLTVGGAGYG